MSRINTPINQVKLTNVAVVRCNKGGKRFEIACYRNKVMDYRSGLEKDLSEVLQAERIFTNVSKGQFANSTDLMKAFGTRDEEVIAKVILEEGKSVQVSELERNQQIQSTLSQITTWVASNCVHPDNGRPYTVSQIKHMLGKHFNAQTHKPIKKQCLDAVKFLKNIIPIERAKMELSIEYEASHHDTVSSAVDRLDRRMVPGKSKTPENGGRHVLVLQVDPSLYRELDELAKSVGGHLEILQQVVSVEGDVDLDQEIQRKQTQTETTKGEEKISEVEDIAVALEQLHVDNTGKEQDSDVDESPDYSNRKGQKKASKKAKKARRRQVDDTAAREQQDESEAPRPVVPQGEKKASSGSGAADSGSKSCNTCGGSFASSSGYRAHFRSDWHRFNQKMKLQGASPVSEEEFKLCDAESFFGAC
jgi:ribosome maturation protein SDO1